MFDELEIKTLNYIAQAFEKEHIKQEQELLKWFKEHRERE